MTGTTEGAPDDLLTCERCHGFYAVQVPEDGGEPRVRCNACGHIREVAITPAPTEQAGKWTVIGPDGKVMTFGSWDKLVESRRPPAPKEGASASVAEPAAKSSSAPDEKRPSASALLDVTPTPALPTLTLAEADSDPQLLAAKALGAESLAKSLAKGKGPEWAPVKTDKKAGAGTEKAPESLDEMDASLVDDEPAPLSLRDAIPDDVETAPLSLRDVIPDDVDETRPWRRLDADGKPVPLPVPLPLPLPRRDGIPDDIDETRPWRRVTIDDEPAPLSLRDAFQIQDKESAPEIVSLKDVVVLVPPAEDSTNAVDSTPAPPARGALKTLPPTKQGDAAPPPTITVEEKAESVPGDTLAAKSGATSKSDTKSSKSDAKKADAKKTDGKKADTAKPTPTSTKKNAASSRDDRKPIASARAAVAEEEPKRGWVLPSLAIIGGTVVIWRMMAASSDQPPAPPQPVATIETPATKETTAPPNPTVEATNAATSAPADTMTVSTTTTSPPATTTATTATVTTAIVATATTTKTAGKKAVTTTAGTDTAPAPAPAEKKPAASESGTSMSDMLDRAGSARRSGDYATARDLYARVLRQNPGNVEANGGLGDVARAQGDLSAAKASYERALATSPTYGPAMLGLADTEWDLGNRAGAQRRYAQIVERLGDRAPERAKQRGAVTE